MDKRAKYKLVRSPRMNGGESDVQKDFHSRKWKGRENGKDTGKDRKRK